MKTAAPDPAQHDGLDWPLPMLRVSPVPPQPHGPKEEGCQRRSHDQITVFHESASVTHRASQVESTCEK
jgi:hypothetical protein